MVMEEIVFLMLFSCFAVSGLATALAIAWKLAVRRGDIVHLEIQISNLRDGLAEFQEIELSKLREDLHKEMTSLKVGRHVSNKCQIEQQIEFKYGAQFRIDLNNWIKEAGFKIDDVLHCDICGCLLHDNYAVYDSKRVGYKNGFDIVEKVYHCKDCDLGSHESKDSDIRPTEFNDMVDEDCIRQSEKKETREKVARLCHTQLITWMNCLLDDGEMMDDGSWCMASDRIAEWEHNMKQAWTGLSIEKQDNFRGEAGKFLKLLEGYNGRTV